MSTSKLSTRFVIFVIVSLITHLLELAASGLFCYMLNQQTDLRTSWFSLAAGLFIIPMVAVQLASAVFLLRRKTETTTTCEVITTAVLHILQLGFISRHFVILKESPLCFKRTEVIEMVILRMSFAFTSGCTLLLLQMYMLLQDYHQQSWIWAAYVSGTTTLISITWGISTFRRCLLVPEFSVLLISWPGTILRLLWRAGEILARIIALGLFASLYTYFLILVIGLHWFSMLICLYIPLISTSMEWPTSYCVRRILIYLMISFAHIFTFVNTSSENAVFRYTFYFVIFFLESATLIAVWFVQSSPEQFSRNNVFAYIGIIVFILSLTSMIVYYKFFHIAAFKTTAGAAHDNSICVTCNNQETSNLHFALPRREISENGQAQNEPQSCIDSELNSTVTSNSSHAPRQQPLYIIENDVQELDNYRGRSEQRERDFLSLNKAEEQTSSKNEAHKMGSRMHDVSTVCNVKMDAAKMDNELPVHQSSQAQPVWLPSGDSNFANQLLTCSMEHINTSETTDSDRSSLVISCNGFTNSCSSSPMELASPTKLKNKTPLEVVSHSTRSFELNSVQDGCNVDRRSSRQKKSLVILPTAYNKSRDSENSNVLCCCSHNGISEIPSLFHSVTTAPLADLKTTKETIPHFLHGDIHRHHYHHRHHTNKHCSNLISTTNKIPSDFLKSHQNDCLPSNDIEDIQDSDNRKAIMSSTVCSPTFDQNTAVIYPSTRHVQISPVDTFTSHSAIPDQYSIRKNNPRDATSSDIKYRDHSLAESERLAVKLLKASAKREQQRSDEKTGVITNLSTSDPRFTIRVMTSPVDKHTSQDGDDSSNKSNKTTVDATKERVDKLSNVWSRESKQINYVEGKQTCRVYDITDIDNVDKKKITCSPSPRTIQDVITVHTNNGTSKSHLTDKFDEIVYENLWPMKCTEDRKSCRTETESGRSDRHDIYICSESEDSALPHEVLSSSAECFTASDSDSNISLEIVI